MRSAGASGDLDGPNRDLGRRPAPRRHSDQRGQEFGHQADGGEPLDRPAVAPDQHASPGRHPLSGPAAAPSGRRGHRMRRRGRLGNPLARAGSDQRLRTLRPGAPDAGLVQRARTAPGPHGARQGQPAGRLFDRRAARRFAPQGAGVAGRSHRSARRLCLRPSPAGVEGRRDQLSVCLSGGHGTHHAGRGPGQGRHCAAQRRP